MKRENSDHLWAIAFVLFCIIGIVDLACDRYDYYQGYSNQSCLQQKAEQFCQSKETEWDNSSYIEEDNYFYCISKIPSNERITGVDYQIKTSNYFFTANEKKECHVKGKWEK